MSHASTRLRPGRILGLGLGLAAAIWICGRMFATMQRAYVSQTLMQAVASKDAAGIAAAVRKGADPNMRVLDGDGYQIPLLFLPIRQNDARLCGLLLDQGARPQVQEIGRDGALHGTALMEAARLGKADMVRLLLDRGASANAHDGEGFSALMCAAISGDTRTVQLLMDRGADVNQRDRRGFSPLLMAEAGRRNAVWTQLARAGATR